MTLHEEHHTHVLKICHPRFRHIPVLVGSVPRRDQPEFYVRYCRLMLILFKPWRTAFDLRASQESWATAFDRFKTSSLCSHEFQDIMNNMQMLHECKDSRDEHFCQRR
ncbi:hypothetical protein M378DRAFT_79693, partial [Amanita muscaria Koide BX008]